ERGGLHLLGAVALDGAREDEPGRDARPQRDAGRGVARRPDGDLDDLDAALHPGLGGRLVRGGGGGRVRDLGRAAGRGVAAAAGGEGEEEDGGQQAVDGDGSV